MGVHLDETKRLGDLIHALIRIAERLEEARRSDNDPT